MLRRFPILLAAASLVLLAGWTAVRAEERSEDPILKIMNGLKSVGRTISLGFARKDKDRVVDGSKELAKAFTGLGELYPVKDDKAGAEDFKKKAEAMTQVAGEFAARAQKVKMEDAKQATELKDFYMDSVRGACIACHNTYWVTYECESKKERWTQAKWSPKSCRVCQKPGCGKQVENEEEE